MAEFQNVYDDLRNKLIARGIPAEEIAYIHTANTEAQKKELFGNHISECGLCKSKGK